MNKVHTSRIDLDPEIRDEMITLLNQTLADVFDLYSQTKQAHWNVKGIEFFQLHELFDTLAADVFTFVDEIAERVTALGGEAKGTARMAASSSQLEEFPAGLGSGKEFAGLVADRFAAFGASVRAGIESAEKAGDQGTMDLLTEVSRHIDKDLWFLEAHLR